MRSSIAKISERLQGYPHGASCSKVFTEASAVLVPTRSRVESSSSTASISFSASSIYFHYLWRHTIHTNIALSRQKNHTSTPWSPAITHLQFWLLLRKPADRLGKVVNGERSDYMGMGAEWLPSRPEISPCPCDKGVIFSWHVPLGNLVTVGFDSPQGAAKRTEKRSKEARNEGQSMKIVKKEGGKKGKPQDYL